MTSLRFLLLFSHTTRVKIHVHYQIHKKKRKDLSQKIALEEFISPLGKQQANSRLTWPPSTSISFSFQICITFIYISQLRDQSLRLYIGRYMYSFIDHIIHTLNLHASSMYKHNLFDYVPIFIHVSTHIRENHPILLSFKSSPFDSYQTFLMPAYCRDSSFSIENIRK